MTLKGHEHALETFTAALDKGKLHHAWLLQGPSGIGKRTLANHLAKILLGVDSKNTAQIDAGAHKDLYIADRTPDAKRRDISVETVRGLITFFQRKSALGGWRVGIVDAMDELNASGTNALLKTLEEPPHNCALFLVSHGRLGLLPTITSRCRVLRLSPLTEPDTAAILTNLGLDAELASRAKGRPGLAIRLADPDARAAYDAAHTLLSTAKPSADAKAYAIRLAGKSDLAFEGFVQGFLARLADMAETAPQHASKWLAASRLYAESLEDALDKTQTAARMLGTLKR